MSNHKYLIEGLSTDDKPLCTSFADDEVQAVGEHDRLVKLSMVAGIRILIFNESGSYELFEGGIEEIRRRVRNSFRPGPYNQ